MACALLLGQQLPHRGIQVETFFYCYHIMVQTDHRLIADLPANKIAFLGNTGFFWNVAITGAIDPLTNIYSRRASYATDLPQISEITTFVQAKYR